MFNVNVFSIVEILCSPAIRPPNAAYVALNMHEGFWSPWSSKSLFMRCRTVWTANSSARYLASVGLSLTHFCRFLVSAITASPYLIKKLERPRPHFSERIPQTGIHKRSKVVNVPRFQFDLRIFCSVKIPESSLCYNNVTNTSLVQIQSPNAGYCRQTWSAPRRIISKAVYYAATRRMLVSTQRLWFSIVCKLIFIKQASHRFGLVFCGFVQQIMYQIFLTEQTWSIFTPNRVENKETLRLTKVSHSRLDVKLAKQVTNGMLIFCKQF